MTEYEVIPVPPSIGEAITDATAWQTWAVVFPAPETALRTRRAGGIRRRMAVLASVVAVRTLRVRGRHCAVSGVPRVSQASVGAGDAR